LCGRYQWNILENGEERDRSRSSFATEREAHLDAERFVDKLNITGQLNTGGSKPGPRKWNEN